MVSVGLIVNPSASHDVRRLTSLARTMSVHERLNAVARIIGGLAASGIDTICYMAEPAGLVERAAELLAATGRASERERLPELRPVLDEPAIDAAGTARAAAAMARLGVACLITHGGDGTHRAAISGWPEAVIVPLAGGTNNAFAIPIDPTAAGLAAGLFAADPARRAGHLHRAPRLEVRTDGRDGAPQPTIALVDVALLDGGSIGARAIWDPGLLLEAVVARSDPALTGLAGVAGMLRPLVDGRGPGMPAGPPLAVHVRFAPGGTTVRVPLGPGRLVPIGVAGSRQARPGEVIELGAGGGARPPGWRTIALDGEREIALPPGERAEVRLATDGPFVLDAASLLRAAAGAGELAGGRARVGDEGRVAGVAAVAGAGGGGRVAGAGGGGGR